MKVEIVVTSPWGSKRAREVFQRLIAVPDLANLALAFLSAADEYRLKRYKGRARRLYTCVACTHSNAKWDGIGFRCKCGCRCHEWLLFKT